MRGLKNDHNYLGGMLILGGKSHLPMQVTLKLKFDKYLKVVWGASEGVQGCRRWEFVTAGFRCCCLNIILILIFSEEYHFDSLKLDEATSQKTFKFLQGASQQRQERNFRCSGRNSMMMISGSRVLSTRKSNMGIFRLETLPINISLNMPRF